MTAAEVSLWLQGLAPHVWAIALICARLLPVVFLCPLLGGELAPGFLKVALVLSIGVSLHLDGGVGAQLGSSFSGWGALVGAVREVLLGIVVGLVASLPFDAARMGGRFVDTFRGTSAEAALPQVGTHESAMGSGLYQVLLTTVAAGPLFGWVTSALWRSFAMVRLGAYGVGEGGAMQLATLVTGALTTALAVSAPVAAFTLAVDGLFSFWGRVAPQLGGHVLSGPLRILGGGVVLWLCLGTAVDRLVLMMGEVPSTLRTLLGG